MKTNHLEQAFDGQGQWWKYLAVIFASYVGGQMVGSIPLVAIMIYTIVKNGGQAPANLFDFNTMGIDANHGLALMLLPFVVSLVVMVFMVNAIHHRTLAQTINGTSNIRWNRIATGFMVWGVLMALYTLASYLADPTNFTFNLQWGRFVVLMLISVLMLPLQTTYEELLFRGYVTQGLAALTRNRWFPMLLSATLFALMHIANPEVAEYGFWLSMPQYFAFGVMFGLVSVLDDGIEIAIGAHAANNIFLSLFVTNSSSVLQTPALLVQNRIDPLLDMVWLVAIAALFVVILAMKYKWQLSLLFSKVEPPIKTNNHEDIV